VKPDTKCEICLKVCADRKGLVAHMRFHGNPAHPCSHCPLKFHTSGQLSHHVTHAHTVKYVVYWKLNRVIWNWWGIYLYLISGMICPWKLAASRSPTSVQFAVDHSV